MGNSVKALLLITTFTRFISHECEFSSLFVHDSPVPSYVQVTGLIIEESRGMVGITKNMVVYPSSIMLMPSALKRD